MPQIVFIVQLSLISVCLQVTVEGFIGGSVVLPCSTEHDHELQDIVVFWRHNNSKIVHVIIKGSQTETQDSLYKNRIESFPEEYLRGNFSIKLNNLTHADAGKYICHITPSELQTVELIINESTAEKGNKTNDQKNPNQAETVPNVVTSSHFQWVSIVVSVLLLLLIVLIVCLIRFYLRRKKAQAPLFSSAMTEEQTTV